MSDRHLSTTNPKPLTALRYPLFVLLIFTLACSLPGLINRPTTTPTSPAAAPTFTPAPPTPTPQPLPPAIVESDPPPGGEVPLGGPITLYFNQPMDRTSVENSLSVQPKLPGQFTWRNETTLVFAPAQPLAPASQITFSLNPGARSARGLALPQPLSLSFQAVGFLKLSQSLPTPDAQDVDPSAAVVAAFNRPVVPLGAEAASLPPAFTLQPAASGKSEWLNTSTYVFYPDPPLEGGKAYSVALTPDLKGVDGSPLESADGWSFTTASPALVSVLPDLNAGEVRLDSVFTMTFNQPMDAASVQANFALLDAASSPVAVKTSWSDDQTALTITPADLLQRSQTYTLDLEGTAQARGGTPLGARYAAGLRTVSPLAVARSDPPQGGIKPNFSGVSIYLNGPILADHLDDQIVVTPPVPNLNNTWYEPDKDIVIYGDFAPDTDYSVTLLPGLSDPWGGHLDPGYTLYFRTAPLNPEVVLSYGNDVLFLTPQDSSLVAQVTNYPSVSLTLGSTPLQDFIAMISSQDSYNLRQNYHTSGETTWSQNLELATNISQAVNLDVSPNGQPLSNGLYYLRLNDTSSNFYTGPFLVVVGNVHLTFKLSATQALVWAVDLNSNTPIRNAPITVYNEKGEAVAQGQTDEQGIFQSGIPIPSDPFQTYYAMLGQPGDASFSLALSTWNQGISSYDFNLPADPSGPRLVAYLYTDRPIYRPGDTVYFRGIARQAYNGRYDLPDLGSLSITLYRNYSDELTTFDLPLSALGTLHGEYTLPPDAPPGEYRLASSKDEYGISVLFQVADYRKPEINLQIAFAADQILSGSELKANISARYFFDAPSSNLPVHWVLYATPSSFSLSDFQVGVQDTGWLEAYNYPIPLDTLGAVIQEGDSTTDPQGVLSLSLPTDATPARMKYILEATATDESGLPVSARASAQANPSPIYAGLRPDVWVGRAGDALGFDVQVVDWQAKPAGVHTLRADFQKVVWIEQERPFNERYLGPKFTPQYTDIGSTDFQTSSEGLARLSFTPPEAGTYMLSVSGEGTRSELYVWIGGKGTAAWPNLPFQRIRLVADKENYKPGETAQVFVPNPFGTSALALVTVERGIVLRHEVLTLQPGGTTVGFDLTTDDAPNVFISVTLLAQDGGQPDFRQGYVDLPVDPSERSLNVTLTSQPTRLGPGEEATFEIQVTDAAGQPVQGEFSLSVVDKAVLALADPNVPDIVPYFYGEQPLGVRTGLSLAAYARRKNLTPVGGMGGGGGEVAPSVVRENFPDTAYWNAEIVTGADGRAMVSLPLPDSLTTWQVLVRGVGQDTRVGQAETEVVVTKDVLVRPVTPRFLAAGDHAQLGAIVQNSTSEDLTADVSIQASGFTLDDPGAASQKVSVPANGRTRLNWWGLAQDVDKVELVFSVSAQSSSGKAYQDAASPTLGDLPVLHYTAPQTFSTAGTMDEGGERLELVSLPASFDPQGGELHVELSSSLGGVMLSGLDALEKNTAQSTETTLSRFLPNLETYRVMQALKIDSPALQARLERTLGDGIARLLARQRFDGGWSWWGDETSDPYITAYILFGLSRARESGAKVSEPATQRAADYLTASMYTPDMAAESWQLDRLAFIHFALSYAGSGDLTSLESLYARREQLNPWGKAVLALAIQRLAPGRSEVGTLLSDLSGSAVRSATGAHWEETSPSWQNMSSPLLNSAVVLYALAGQQPDAPLLADAVRYLMSNRRANGTWSSPYTTAWTLMALTEVMRASGELGGGFAFSARLNGVPIANGQASGEGAPVVADIPLSNLYVGDPNALNVQRGPGDGRLYYTAALNVDRPVEDVAPLQRGVSVQRAYYPTGAACPGGDCAPITQAHPGDLIRARLSLTLENAAYFLLVQDYLPAGTEVLDTSLKTSQQGQPEEQPQGPFFDPRRPFDKGWGWWYFTTPSIYDDHVSWASAYLPAGSYELNYLLVVLQPGEYRVLPARAWMFYFPEVQGNSAGDIFTIQP